MRNEKYLDWFMSLLLEMPRYSVQQHHQLLHNLKETSLLTCTAYTTVDMLDMTGGAAVRLKFESINGNFAGSFFCDFLVVCERVIGDSAASKLVVSRSCPGDSSGDSSGDFTRPFFRWKDLSACGWTPCRCQRVVCRVFLSEEV